MEKVGRLGSRVVAIVAALAAFVVLLLDLFFGAAACGWDTSYCARTIEKNGYYEATLPGVQEGAQAQVYFESRRNEPRVPVTVGPGGRLCIVWAEESVTPGALAEGHETSLQDWRSGPPPPGCQTSDAEIPWNRAEGITSRWQYRVTIAIPALALILLALSAFLPLPLKGRLRYAGSATVVAAVVVAVAIV